MYLKSLFLHGFKSFPSSVTLEFNQGITSVVGPNGSGKSNVSDAIRWVIGEQSAKNLRGTKMEDVIFFGTANRKSVGYCEVSIVLDNTDRQMQLDFDEIKITRRQTRSGESTYQINGINSRLKDIQELFMDTGIGKEGYSIIGQGRIEEILKAKSDERRLLFEEATGIVKYKKRRTDANAKLTKQHENLLRVNDILKELEMQLEPLKIQSEKAKQYLVLYDKKKSFQISLFITDISEKEAIEKKYITSIETFKQNISDKQKEYDEKEKTIVLLNDEQEELKSTLKSLYDDLSNGKDFFKNLSHNILINEERISSIDDKLINLSSEIESKNTEILRLEDEVKKENNNISLTDNILTNLKNDLLEKEEEIKVLQQDLGINDKNEKELNKKILENAENIAKTNSKILNEEDIYENLNNETELIVDNIKLLKSEIDEFSKTINKNEVLINDTESQINSLKDAIKEYDEKVKTIKEEQFTLSNERNKINQLYHEKNAKLKALEDAKKSHLGYYDSVKFVLNKRDNNDVSFSGVLGTIGDIFTTKREYELALETVLASQVQNIVTDNEITAKNIINILRKENKGRCTFLPLNTVRTYNDIDRRMLDEKGVIGFFSELVNYDDIFKPIANSLLQKTLVIDTLDNAIIFNNKFKNKIRIITLTGDLLSTTGSMSGGSNKKSGNSVFSNKRLLQESTNEVTELLTKLKELDISMKKQDETSNHFRTQLSLSRTTFTQKQEVLQEVKNEYSTSKLKYQFKSDELSKIQDKDKTLLNQIESKNLEIKSLYSYLDELNKLKERLNVEYLEFTKNLDINKDKKDKQQNILMELNVKITKENEQLNSYKHNIKRLEKSILNITNDIEKLENNIILEKEIKLNLDNSIDETIKRKENVSSNNDAISKNILLKEKALSDKHKNQLYLIDTNKYLFIEINELSKALDKDELYLTNISDQITKLYDDMWNEYELTYQTCLEFPKIDKSYDEIKKDFRETSIKIKQLGEVNMLSIEQYKDVFERYEFLLSQKQDIVDGEKKLDIIIKDLTSLMETQFTEQFITIRDNFKEVFSNMFGGGMADLILTEPNDPLNSPIEILAEPPGKKLKNLMLMSGGEKSLTAICLLFGILKMKPSPFCILDEIEAALDDANVDRYAHFLSEFKNETQFILITHRKGTMVIADTLYGVTMEEMGISKLVSVKLEDYN